MNTVVSQRRTRAVGLETTVRDLDHPAINLLAEYLQSMMEAPTHVSMNPKVTSLLGYRWVCKPGFTIPKAKPVKWSVDETEAVKRALEHGTLRAVVETPLCLGGKRIKFAEDLLRQKDEGYRNCVYLMNCGKKRRKRSRDEDTDDTCDKKSRTMTQLAKNDLSSDELPGACVSHDLAPIPRDSSASRLALPEPWTTKVKSVENKAGDPSKKGATMICLTGTGKKLTLKSLRPLLTGDGELDCEIVDACLSSLICPTHRLEARPKTVLFESAFWQTYQRHREHLGRWYDMVAPLEDMEMLLFPVYQNDHWTLFEVSGTKKMIKHYAPVGLSSTNVMNMAKACLKTEFGIEGWTIRRQPLQGNSVVLMLATAIQRVLRKDSKYSEEDIPKLRRWIAAILLGMNVFEVELSV